tara:strand:- start:2073 stop:3788 length:1716 start_codon:yes stop_codon:yes gene_type:complete
MNKYLELAHNTLIQKGFSLNIMTYSGVHDYCYVGKVDIPQVQQGYVDVLFGFNEAPFFDPPSVYLVSRPSPLDEFWPNIEKPKNGLHKLCIFDTTTHKLEPYAIEEVIDIYLKRVKGIVARNSKERLEAFKAEVTAYFPRDFFGYYVKKPTESILSIRLYESSDESNKLAYVAKSSQGCISHITQGNYSPIPTIITNIEEIKTTPKGQAGLGQISGFIDIIRGTKKETLAILKEKLQSLILREKDNIKQFGGFAICFYFNGNIYAYIFKLARVQVKQLQIRSKNFIERLLRGQLRVMSGKFGGELVKITKVHLTDGSQSTLIKRNYSQNLVDKQICIIGAGTLGSYLAHILMKHGAGSSKSLHIYDDDLLLPQNISRHLLGAESLFINKAQALVNSQKKLAPNNKLISHKEKFTDLNQIPQGTDIVIDATGEFSTAMTLNHQYRSKEFAFKLYHSYLCAGGHSARLFKQGDGGCYRCLFDNEHEHIDKEFKKAEHKALITRNCGESNVQFPVDSSIGAASFIAANILECEYSDKKSAYIFFRTLGKKAAEHKNKPLQRSPYCPACKVEKNE